MRIERERIENIEQFGNGIEDFLRRVKKAQYMREREQAPSALGSFNITCLRPLLTVNDMRQKPGCSRNDSRSLIKGLNPVSSSLSESSRMNQSRPRHPPKRVDGYYDSSSSCFRLGSH